MKGLMLTFLVMCLMGLTPLLDIVFGVPMVALMWFWWGIVVGVPLGILADKAEIQDRARREKPSTRT